MCLYGHKFSDQLEVFLAVCGSHGGEWVCSGGEDRLISKQVHHSGEGFNKNMSTVSKLLDLSKRQK